MRLSSSLATVCILVATSTAALAQTFRFVQPSPGYTRSFDGGFSDDLRVYAGLSEVPLSPLVPYLSGFIEVPGSPRYDLHPSVPTSLSNIAKAVSGNGSTVVGAVDVSSSVRQAATFDVASRTATLYPNIPGFSQLYFKGTSFDANVMFGEMSSSTLRGSYSFRATRGNAPTRLPGVQQFDDFVIASAISADGSVIVGQSAGSQRLQGDAVKWRADGSVEVLQELPGIPKSFQGALGISRNGNYVAGYGGFSSDIPVIWHPSGAPEDITDSFLATARSSRVTHVSDDGNSVVGLVRLNQPGLRDPDQAFIWRRGIGAMLLADYLMNAGVVVPSGTQLRSVTWVSPDFTTFSGNAFRGSQLVAFVATIPGPGSLCCLAVSSLTVSRRRRGT